MAYIQLRDRQYPIGKGPLRVGTSQHAEVRLAGAEVDAPQAVVDTASDGSVSIRRGSPDAVVKVNGVQVGVEPTPLIHGDKIEIAGLELLFGDDRKGGSTQYLGGIKAVAKAASPNAAVAATAATGGRLVSLVDGREYPVGAQGATIGRDAGCEIVVPSTEVSRRHALIAPGEGGYVVHDLSTNGVLVNGERVAKTRVLGRGDVIRIGEEEFRFYADVAPPSPAGGGAVASAAAPVHPAAAAPPVSATAPPVSRRSGELAGSGAPATGASVAEPVHPAAAGEAAAAPKSIMRPALAVVEIINEGILKGKRFEIRTPLTHVGRGEHNDIAIADDSVSDSHAKIQKRDAGWFVVDMGSTNGTYVGGRRIDGEKQLIGSPDIRFGGIKMTFQVSAENVDEMKGTRAIAGLNRAQARQLAAAATPRPQAAPIAEEPPSEKPRSFSIWLWLAVLVLLAGAAYFVMQGRA
jgi:pSer/pThr/pTyr-binding forkhead associated (FHA) protein